MIVKKPADKPDIEDTSSPNYAAPALEKGLDILETLARSERPLSQKEIATTLDRSVGELYRMLNCLVSRDYVANLGETYQLTTKLFELAHLNPPTQKLLSEALPIMQRLSNELDQSCHITVYNQGKQIVIAKVDSPTDVGFSVRVGAEFEVLISASGRVLVAFQDDETMHYRIKEALNRRPDHANNDIVKICEKVRKRGFESFSNAQVKGLHAVSFPVLNSQARAIAALTVPFAERLDPRKTMTIKDVESVLGAAAHALSRRIGGRF